MAVAVRGNTLTGVTLPVWQYPSKTTKAASQFMGHRDRLWQGSDLRSPDYEARLFPPRTTSVSSAVLSFLCDLQEKYLVFHVLLIRCATCFHILCCICVSHQPKEAGKCFPFLERPSHHFSTSSVHPSWTNSGIHFLKRKLRPGVSLTWLETCFLILRLKS